MVSDFFIKLSPDFHTFLTNNCSQKVKLPSGVKISFSCQREASCEVRAKNVACVVAVLLAREDKIDSGEAAIASGGAARVWGGGQKNAEALSGWITELTVDILPWRALKGSSPIPLIGRLSVGILNSDNNSGKISLMGRIQIHSLYYIDYEFRKVEVTLQTNYSTRIVEFFFPYDTNIFAQASVTPPRARQLCCHKNQEIYVIIFTFLRYYGRLTIIS